MNAVIYHGNTAARKVIRQKEFLLFEKKKNPEYKFQVLITSPDMYTNSKMEDVDILLKIKWQTLIVDEAHRLKNHSSKLYSVLKKLKTKSTVLLTGTPIQNNLEELGALLHFLQPAVFPNIELFLQKYSTLTSSDNVKELHVELRPFLLRRMKEDVEKTLKPKEEVIIQVELTSLQKHSTTGM